MKRGTPDHPKLKRLARALGLEQWGAVGVLESIWHFAARFAPQGDVGRFTNEDIADGIGWADNAEKLIQVLVDTGWLDTCETYRLVIHDWHEHADEAVKKTLARRKLEFASVATCRDNGATRPEKNCLPEPLPLPLPLPEPRKEKTSAPRGAGASRHSWLTPAGEVWQRLMGGKLPMGRTAKAFAPEYTDGAFPPGFLDAWEAYLKSFVGNGKNASAATPENFVSRWRTYAPKPEVDPWAGYDRFEFCQRCQTNHRVSPNPESCPKGVAA